MPFLAKEFGLLPWHFGGEPYLTYLEADVFTEAARRMADSYRESEKQAKNARRRRR